MKKKIFAMFLALVMVFSMAVGAYAEETEADAEPALVVEVNQGKASAEVSVYLQGCDGVTNGTVSIGYDASVFRFAEAQASSACAINSVNSETAGTVSFAWVGSELTDEKTLMLTLVLEAKNIRIQKENIEYSASSSGIYAGTEAVDVLGASITVSQTPMNDDELEKLIEEAEAKNKYAYTSASWEKLEKALAEAVAVYADSEATQEEIDAAYAALKDALDSLVIVETEGEHVHYWSVWRTINGVRSRVCNGCGAVEYGDGTITGGESEETEPGEETENPGTGSDFNIVPVMAAVIASVIGIVLSMRSRKARKFLCLILAVTMIITVAPVNVFAQVINGNETERNTEKPADTTTLQQITEEHKGSIVDAETEQIVGSVAQIENPGADIKLDQNLEASQVAVFEEDEMVRVIVELEGKGLLEQGYTQNQISAYGFRVSADNDKLEKAQNYIAAEIEEVVAETGLLPASESVEVRYNFTIALNGVAMTVPYGSIDEIRGMEGVKGVYVTSRYLVPENAGNTSSPNMYATSESFGSERTWTELGYTGKGMSIAIIDTGLDIDHPSFAAAPEGASITLSDVEAVLTKLNAYELYGQTSAVALKADQLYRSEKVPYGFNYVDRGLDITHDYDEQGDHGTHVAGIAAANKLDSTKVVGVAPDAQVVVMKVFGQNGGAYSEDIIAAIEDCITLGVDVINMSLGAQAGFSSDSALINEVYGRILETDMILAVAAGNANSSATGNAIGTNVNFAKDPDNGLVNSPATYLAATTVASVENVAMMMPYFKVGEEKIAYVDVTFYNFAALEGTYEYVVVPGLGEMSDYEGLDVSGKIALVERGTIDFTTKQENAYKNGAVALVVYDNVYGDLISMYDAGLLPNVFISKADGEKMLAAAENGVGTLTIMPYGEETAIPSSVAGYVSDFSCWGVTPDLQLTPDVSAPGGNIYSCFTDGAYGTMSGTSMASPHIAGMSALVLQYLHDKYPAMSDEEYHIAAESLVMATAVPVYDEEGILYSPRKQGAGSANVYNAIVSPVYLTSYQTATGEYTPKASVGDDPERTGVYTFTFDMHNMSDADQVYALAGHALTDQVISIEGFEEEFMSETGRNLSADVVFEAPNASIMPLGYDLNGDGITNTKDIQFMLDYVNGISGIEWNEENNKLVDFDGDGELDTVDVQIFYETAIEGSFELTDLVTVPANSTITVKVTVTLTAEDKAYMDAHYPNGIYVDGFVRAYAQSDGAVDLSFPFVAFYGDWTDADVFDSGWYYEDAEDVLYNRYWNVIFTTLGADATSMGGLGLNPYLANDPYTPEHNVLSPNGDTYYDYVSDIYMSLLRSAELLDFTWTDEEGNEIFYEWYLYARKSYYWSGYGMCLPAMYSDAGCLPFTMYDENGNLTVEDLDRLTLTIRAYLDDGDLDAIEYPEDADHAWADDVVEIPVVIDIKAPTVDLSTIEYVEKDGRNFIRINVEDNYDIAAIVTMTEGGDAYEYIPVNTKEEGVDGEKATIEIDVTDYDAKFQLVICDYGCNESYYVFANEANTGLSSDRFFAYRRYSFFESDGNMYATDQLNGWYSFETADEMTAHTSQPYSGEATVYAAEYVDGYIFGAQAGSNGYNTIFVTKAGSWDRIRIGSDNEMRQTVYAWPGRDGTYFPLQMIALDMTYDYTSDTMYILANAFENNYFPEGVENILLELNINTGKVTVLGIIEPTAEEEFGALTLACDNDGVLYTINYLNGQLYTIDVENAEVGASYVSSIDGKTVNYYVYKATSVDKDGVVQYYPSAYTQSMTVDHETNKLYWAGYQGIMGTSYFLELDKTTGDIVGATYTADNAEIDALFKPWNTDKDIVPDAELESISLDRTELYLNVGTSALLTVMPSPYNASLGNVEWYSENEEIASVNNYGIIEAKNVGSTVIVASCGEFEVQCTVSVSDVEGTLYAFSGGSWYLMDAGDPSGAVQVVDTMELDGSVKAAAYFGGSIYASVSENYASEYASTIYKLDPNTLSGEILGTVEGEITGLAFNYAEGFLYGIIKTYNKETECDDYDLIRVNTKNGGYIVAASLKDLYNSENWDLCSGALAIDYEGNFYVNGSNAEGWNDIYTIKRFNLDENGNITNVTVCSDFAENNEYGDAMVWSEHNGGIIYVSGNDLQWIDVSDMENVNIIDLGTVRGAGYTVTGLVMPLNAEPELPKVTPTAVYLEESYTVPEDETVTVTPTTDPWNATGEFTYETADTSIAVVDENGVVTGVSIGETTVTVTEKLSGLSATAKVVVEKNPGYLYGFFQAYITEQIPMEAWGKIPIADPAGFNLLSENVYDLTIYAAAYYDGFIYACGQHSTDGKYYMLKISPSNFSYEIISEPDFLVRDMAFDYTTGTMYAVGYDELVKGGLYAFDTKTGEFTFIADNDLGATLVALACDENGVLYAADDYGEVVIVDKNTAELQSTGIYGGSSQYLQSMVYDYNNDLIYWAKGGNIYAINTDTMRYKNIGSTECSVSGLFTVPQIEIVIPETVEPSGVALDEKNTVAVGDTLAIEAVVLPVTVSAMDKTLVWSSSDENIAVVDENGVVTGISEGKVYITATNVNGNSDAILITVTADQRYFYGYDELSNSWIQFDKSGAVLNSWQDMEGTSPIAAAQYIDGVLYAYDADGFFYSVNTETFERTFLGNGINGFVANGLEAWDEANGVYYVDGIPYKMIDLTYSVIEGRRGTVTTLYGVMMAYNVSDWRDDFSYIVAKLDMETGEITEIIVQDMLVDREMSLRPSNLIYRGDYLYTVNGYITGMVTRIDPWGGEVTGTAIFAEYWGDFNGGRSMIEDPLTGTVYAIRDKRTDYIGQEDYTGEFSESVLCTVNLGIAKCDAIKTIGTNVRLTGMFIK